MSVDNSKLPLVTIMIPTYNQEKVIGRAIESALAQTYAKLEVIVCDDNSKDNTKLVVERYLHNPKVRYYRNEKNLGRVGNYRRLIYELAKGEWVLNLDGDDYLTYPKYIEEAIQVIQKDSEVILVFARQKYENEGTGEVAEQWPLDLPEIIDGNQYLINSASYKDGVPYLSSLFHKEHAKQRQVQMNDIIASDTEAIFRIVAGKKIGFIPKFVGTWCFNDKNESSNIDVAKRIKNLEMILGPAESFKNNQLISKDVIEKFRYRHLQRAIKIDCYLFLNSNALNQLIDYLRITYKTFGWYIHLNVIFNYRFIAKLLLPKAYTFFKKKLTRR